MTDCTSYTHLSIDERLVIQIRHDEGDSPETIAGLLGRDPSTVRRELWRNSTLSGYRATTAQHATRRRRPARLHWMEEHPSEAWVILGLMEKKRSVAQAVWLAEHALGYAVCTAESVYEWIRKCKSSMALYARTLMVRYRPKMKGRERKGKRGLIPGIVGIEERPFDFLDRSEFGHWEGDLVTSGAGLGASSVITLVERVSRYTLVRKVSRRSADVVGQTLISMIRGLPAGVVRTITWDRGRELMRHQDITRATGVLIFFCKPKSPWQRGTNENTNGVLRRRHPKGTNFADVTHQMVRETQIWLNTRPMPVLSWATPNEVFTEMVRALQT
jgi:IS30 family transposase